jgi:hypothetical protein
MKAFAACLLPFIFLATLNSAGYRYGASDQAFYIPAVLLRLDPSLYPRDRDVLAAQAPLTGADEIVAAIVRVTGSSVPAACAVLYVASLTLLALAAWLIAGAVYRTSWAGVALLAALTLRHAVPDSGTNTLEGYFHPRQLAFAIGALAIAAFLRRRVAIPAALLAAAAALHPPTTLWFAVCLGTAALAAERRLRPILAAVAVVAAAGAVWAIAAGPIAARLVVMDEVWLGALADKDYLFPQRWSWDAWLVNLAYLPVILWIYRSRARAGVATDWERGLVAGCVSLAAVFALALPLNAAGVALAVQLQPGRVFWLLDFVAMVYLVWWIAENGDTQLFAKSGHFVRAFAVSTFREKLSVPVSLTAALLLASVVRSGYLYFVMFPNRPIAEVYVRDDDWGRAMAWAQRTDVRSGWLADPVHAAKYGTSVRLAGRRDVLVEALKDGALGLYDRRVAMRTRERLEAIGSFDALTPARARALAGRYDLDYLVTEQRLDLPVAFASGALRVYSIR